MRNRFPESADDRKLWWVSTCLKTHKISAFLASLWTANWFGWCVPVSPTVVADADAAELLPCFWLGPGPDDDAEAALDDWDDSDSAALVEGLQKLDIVMFVRCVCRKLWSWCWCFCPLAWLVKAASPILEMSNCDWHTRHFACLTWDNNT